MDNLPPSPASQTSPPVATSPRKKLLVVGVVVTVLVVVGVILLQTKVTKKLPSVPGVTKLPTVEPSPLTATGSAFVAEVEKVLAEGKIPASEKVATVGQETIYGADVTFLAYYSNKQFYSDKATTAELVKKTFLPTLIDNSVMLQAGKKMGLVQLSNDIFNNPKKDQLKRLKLVNQTINQINQQAVKYSGSVISIWYFDQAAPKQGLTQAKLTARAKIEAIYDQVKTGQQSMKDMAESIKNDPTLAGLDANYQANAYYQFSDLPLERVASFEELRQAVGQLQPGSLSEIINIVNEASGKVANHEELFAFVQLTGKSTGNAVSYYPWLDNQRKQYEVKTF